MRVTLDIDRQLLKDVVALTGQKSTKGAVRLALEEYVRQKKIDDLMRLSGKVELELDWRKLRHGEAKAPSCRRVPPFTVRQAHLKWLREAARKGRRMHKPRSP